MARCRTVIRLPIITGHEPCGLRRRDQRRTHRYFGQTGESAAIGSSGAMSLRLLLLLQRRAAALHLSGRASWGHNRSDQYPYLLGSCAEYMYVPPPCLIIKVPEEVSSASAAASACAYRTVMHGFDRLGAIKSHETRGDSRQRAAGQFRHRRGPRSWRKEGVGHRRAGGAIWKSPSAWARTRC